jgi:hypothetical protein
MSASHTIRVIAFQEGEHWVAQCLEHDICAIAHDLETLKYRVEVAVEAERLLCQEKGTDLDSLPEAPKYFFDKWERRSEFDASGQADGVGYEMALCA